MPEPTPAANGTPAKPTARTLSAVTKEVDQLASEITSLELQIQAKREKFEETVREAAEMQSQTLSRFGMRLEIVNERDNYPVVDRHRARAARFAQQQTPTPRSRPSAGDEGPTRRELKEWAARTGWTFNTNSPVAKGRNRPAQFDKRLPVDMEEALERDYQAAQEAMKQSTDQP